MKYIEKYKPYVALILLQVMSAGMALFTKAAVGHPHGIKPSVFVFYRQAFATLSVAPFALFLERKMAVYLSFTLLCKIFMVSFGITMTFNLYSYGLKYATASIAAASTSMVPVITFLFALCLRMESISMKEWHGKAKVVGSIVCICGAFVYAFFKGIPLYSYSYSKNHNQNLGPPISNGDLIKGSIVILASMTIWSFWIVMQTFLMKQYPAKLRLVTLQSMFSCIQAAIWAIILDKNISTWKLGWNLNLLSAVYCGVVVTGIGQWLRLYGIQKKGPVFAALFTPLILIVTLIVSISLWKEVLHLGSVCGAILLVVGLYSFLWGKIKEEEEEKEQKQQQQQQQILNERSSVTKDGNSDTLECITP